jgi:hypothetical protein
VILVGQEVVGKSKFPHNKVGKFQRYKAWAYADSNKPHHILYARYFIAAPDEAIIKAKQVSDEMFNTYIFGMDDFSNSCVKNFTVILHNITENNSQKVSTTFADLTTANSLFPTIKITNRALNAWGVVKGLK